MTELKIKEESLPLRCEICHQSDCYDAVDNKCSRCADIKIEVAQTNNKFNQFTGHGIGVLKFWLLTAFPFLLFISYCFITSLHKDPQTVLHKELQHKSVLSGIPADDTRLKDEKIYELTEAGLTAPRIITKPKPDYTDEARKAHIAGTVVLTAVFTKRGDIANVRLIKGLGYGLDEAAIESAYKIRFAPGLNLNQPINVKGRIEYTFLRAGY